MRIEKLNVEDIDKIMELEIKCFGKIAEKKEIIIDRIKTFNEGCLGIFEKNNLIGYCSSEIWNKYVRTELNMKASIKHKENGKVLYISGMGVDPKYQNSGLGSKMLKKLIELAKNKKIKEIYLRTSFPKSVNFYEKNNFKLVEHVLRENEEYDVMMLKIL